MDQQHLKALADQKADAEKHIVVTLGEWMEEIEKRSLERVSAAVHSKHNELDKNMSSRRAMELDADTRWKKRMTAEVQAGLKQVLETAQAEMAALRTEVLSTVVDKLATHRSEMETAAQVMHSEALGYTDSQITERLGKKTAEG